MSKGHFSGGKISKSHSSVIPAAVPLIKKAKLLPEITKIVLSLITSKMRVGKHRIKFMPESGGWKIVIRGTTSLQIIFIHTTDPQKTKTELMEVFNKSK